MSSAAGAATARRGRPSSDVEHVALRLASANRAACARRSCARASARPPRRKSVIGSGAGWPRGRGRPSARRRRRRRAPPAMTTTLRRERAEDVAEPGDAGDRQRRARAAPERTEKSSSARSASASGSSSSRVASPIRTAAGRIGGGARRCARSSQSVGPARGERPGRRVDAVALADLVERRKQDLLDRALDRAQRERGLHRARRRGRARRPCSAPTRTCVSALSASRAREIAEEIDSPSCSASRSAAISPCV